MPSFPFTPASLALSGGSFNPVPVRFSFTAGALVLSGGSMNAGPSLSSSVSDTLAAVLDTLFSSEAIVDTQGRPTRRFQVIWQNAIGGLKDLLESQGASISELQAIYAGINTAQSTAAAAAQQVQASATADALEKSFTDPVGVVSAGSGGLVAIAAHDRIYGDGTSAAVNSGSVSGFAPGDYVTIYYSDPSRGGGAVTYQGTTGAIAQQGSTHIVGQVTIPQVGEPDAGGVGPTAPGWTPPDGDTREYNYL